MPAVRVSYATRPGGSGGGADGVGEAANEDYVAAGPGWAFVLDGATAPAGVDTGCRHGVRWFATRLGAALAGRLAAPGSAPLTDLLAAAIVETRDAHVGGCDLDNPDSPSATVAVVRRSGAGLDYLVLADSAVLLPDADGGVVVHCDRRLDHLPGGRPYSRDLVRRHRNVPGGFWVAGADPAAARQALTGSVPEGGTPFALLTDGCTRLVDRFGYPWRAVWETLADAGPEAVISWVRREERSAGAGPGKRHDDATALYGAFDHHP